MTHLLHPKTVKPPDRLQDTRGRSEGSMAGKMAQSALARLLDPARIDQNHIQLPDRRVPVLMISHSPRLVLLGDLVSADECEQLIELACQRSSPDTVIRPHGTGVLNPPLRGSQGFTLRDGEYAVVERLQDRITALTGCERARRDPLTLSRYPPGQAFAPHHDCFERGEAGGSALTARTGPRVATLVLYLNELADGGATLFPDLGIEIRPQRGAASYFAYQRGDGSADPRSRHGGAGMSAGEKWIATVWLRERVA